MAFLITGGCGFVGSNVAAELLRDKAKVIVLDDLSRTGSNANLDWLKTQGDFRFLHTDVRNSEELEALFEHEEIECVFHLAGQVSMVNSLASPRRDFEVNVLGTINLLEVVRRRAPEATVVYASSNKVYGDLADLKLDELKMRYQPHDGKLAIDESARLDFRTPYGCSKGAADQYMQEYARSFGVRTVVFRHSTIYGGRQNSTYDQGWVGWFCKQAVMKSRSPEHRFTINGNGKQVRDLLYVSDAVRCYRAAHEHIEQSAGQVFNIGGGPENSMSLLELFDHLGMKLGIEMQYERLPERDSDQKYFVADNSRARRLLKWSPYVDKIQGIDKTIAWEMERARFAVTRGN